METIPAIEFRNVSLSFDEKRVLCDIDLKLERGEMIFITGEAGAGKSVLRYRPFEGAIDFLSIKFIVGRDHETKLRSSDQS